MQEFTNKNTSSLDLTNPNCNLSIHWLQAVDIKYGGREFFKQIKRSIENMVAYFGDFTLWKTMQELCRFSYVIHDSLYNITHMSGTYSYSIYLYNVYSFFSLYVLDKITTVFFYLILLYWVVLYCAPVREVLSYGGPFVRYLPLVGKAVFKNDL